MKEGEGGGKEKKVNPEQKVCMVTAFPWTKVPTVSAWVGQKPPWWKLQLKWVLAWAPHFQILGSTFFCFDYKHFGWTPFLKYAHMVDA